MRTKATATPLLGCWRIVESEMWDAEFLDLDVPAHFEFGPDNQGYLAFGCVGVSLDYRATTRDGCPAVEFSFDGFDEADPTSGRGWARLNSDGSLSAYLFIHNGDESAFTATAATTPLPKPRATTTQRRRRRRR
jgi:hypothetical protein